MILEDCTCSKNLTSDCPVHREDSCQKRGENEIIRAENVEPREWAITANSWIIMHPDLGGALEVVAKSAFDQLQKERDELKSKLDKVRFIASELIKNMEELSPGYTERLAARVALEEELN